MKIDLEEIQKGWLIIGTLLASFAFPWVPGFVTAIFSPEGTDLFFRLFGAVAAVWQFLPFRTGKVKGQPAQLKKMTKNMHVAKYLWPFTRAAA